MSYFAETDHPRSASVGLFLGFLVLYRSSIIIYRLFLSPLSVFPGPKIAAATSLYEHFFNVVRNGKFVFEVERLHNIYGPIVRINPFELSIRDPDFYDKLYVSANVRPTERDPRFLNGSDLQGSHLLTVSHDLHRSRRKPLEPYFSRLGATRLEPTIQDLVSKLLKRFEMLEGTGTVIRLDHAFFSYTTDMISRICFRNHKYCLDAEDFSADWCEGFHTVIKLAPFFEAFPGLIRIVRLIPKPILRYIAPKSQRANDFRIRAEAQIVRVKEERKEELGTSTRSEDGRKTRTTLFEDLVRAGMPERELSTTRLVNEVHVLFGAGIVTTQRALDTTAYHILDRSDVKVRLQEELDTVMAQFPEVKPTWAQLEKLPYLQAVIKEGLRMSYGTMRRLLRVSPRDPIQFQEYTIPPGVPVGMSAYMQHTDPTIFPRPFEFVPERWLPENVTPAMLRNFVPFTKGSRSCVAMNLAYAEITLMLAALFRKGGPRMELFETGYSDVNLAHDFVVPLPDVHSKGLRVKFVR